MCHLCQIGNLHIHLCSVNVEILQKKNIYLLHQATQVFLLIRASRRNCGTPCKTFLWGGGLLIRMSGSSAGSGSSVTANYFQRWSNFKPIGHRIGRKRRLLQCFTCCALIRMLASSEKANGCLFLFILKSLFQLQSQQKEGCVSHGFKNNIYVYHCTL